MAIKNLVSAADLEGFAGYVAELSRAQGHEHGHGGDGTVETVREDDHEGHHIVIRTTYRIEVDGKVLSVPLGVDNDGNLHCHSLPNYQFASAVDMVKRLIDNFPEEFTRKRGAKKQSGGRGSKKSAQDSHNHGAHKHSKKGGK